MISIKLNVNGPRDDPDLGIICTVDAFMANDDKPGVFKTWFVKTADVYQAVKEVAENIEATMNQPV